MVLIGLLYFVSADPVGPNSIAISSNETSVAASVSKNITASEGSIVSWRYYACDQSENCNSSGLYNFTVAQKSPTFADVINNTGTTKLTTASMNATISDETALSSYTFSHNMSGSWVNDTPIIVTSQTSVTANKSFTIDISEGSVFSWQYYANDTSGNNASTGVYNITVLTVNPTFADAVNDSDITKHQNITMNVTITDLGGITNYTFSWNDTGSFVNDTAIQFSNETSVYANVSKQITAKPGTVISWIYYACDQSENCNSSGLYNFTVNNTKPVITGNWTSPGTPDFGNDVYNWINISDEDGESILMQI